MAHAGHRMMIPSKRPGFHRSLFPFDLTIPVFIPIFQLQPPYTSELTDCPYEMITHNTNTHSHLPISYDIILTYVPRVYDLVPTQIYNFVEQFFHCNGDWVQAAWHWTIINLSTWIRFLISFVNDSSNATVMYETNGQVFGEIRFVLGNDKSYLWAGDLRVRISAYMAHGLIPRLSLHTRLVDVDERSPNWEQYYNLIIAWHYNYREGCPKDR